MSDQKSRQQTGPARSFVPAVSPLEIRCLMSTGARGVGAVPELGLEPPPPPFPVLPVRLPRTGGVSTQVGAIIGIGVGHPPGNAVQINDEGAGNYQADWNGGPVHSFTGVQAIGLFAERATHGHITINLTNSSAAAPQVGLDESGRADAVHANTGARPAILRTSGNAVQTGTALSVTVDKPTSNQVVILDQGEGGVEVEWNGDTIHSFTGVSTILVEAEKAKNDRIIFYTPPLT